MSSELAVTLSVADSYAGCTTLGPGRRMGLWVQGCPLRCGGCVAPETLSTVGGTDMLIEALAADMATHDDLDGLTISGGEPFAQAAALVRLIDELSELQPAWTTVVYSGFSIEWLRHQGTADQRALLARCDLLIDGPYRDDLHASLRWRGSSNQRLHYLSGRISDEIADDTTAGLQFTIDEEDSVRWIGVPPVPSFRARFEDAMTAGGVVLGDPTGGPS